MEGPEKTLDLPDLTAGGEAEVHSGGEHIVFVEVCEHFGGSVLNIGILILCVSYECGIGGVKKRGLNDAVDDIFMNIHFRRCRYTRI